MTMRNNKDNNIDSKIEIINFKIINTPAFIRIIQFNNSINKLQTKIPKNFKYLIVIHTYIL